MNDSQQGSTSNAGTMTAMGFILGAVVGVGVAILFAPASGEDTRRRLGREGRRWSGLARRQVERALDTAGNLRDSVGNLRDDAKSALKAGQEAFEQGRNSHEPLTTITEEDTKR